MFKYLNTCFKKKKENKVIDKKKKIELLKFSKQIMHA